MIRNVKLKVRKIRLDLFNERQKLKILFLVKIGENQCFWRYFLHFFCQFSKMKSLDETMQRQTQSRCKVPQKREKSWKEQYGLGWTKSKIQTEIQLAKRTCFMPTSCSFQPIKVPNGSARKIVVKIQTVFVVRLERNHDKIIVVI